MNQLIDYISCPISKLIYAEPVKAADGYTYERNEILRWFKDNNTSPSNGLVIDKILIHDFSMKSLVEKFLMDNPSEINNRYVLFIDYKKATSQVCTAFINRRFSELLKYSNFDLRDIIFNDETMLCHLAKVDDINIFKYICENSNDKNITNISDNHGYFLIHYVVKHSPIVLDSLEYLYKFKQNFNVRSLKDKMTPLIHMMRSLSSNNGGVIIELIAKSLLSKGTDPFLTVGTGYDVYDALYFAIKNRHVLIIDLLWNYHRTEYEFENYSRLHLISKYCPNLVGVYINKSDKGELTKYNRKHNTFLYTYFENASLQHCIEFLILLFKPNANFSEDIRKILLSQLLDKQELFEYSAISPLVRKHFNSNNLWKLLFENNVCLYGDYDKVNSWDLYNLIQLTNSEYIVDLIINYIKTNELHKKTIKFNLVNVFVAKKIFSDSIVIKFFDILGFNEIPDSRDQTILHYILMYRRSLLNYILKYYSNVDLPDILGFYPIHLAAMYIGLEGIKILVNKGANYNVSTKNDEDTVLYKLIYHNIIDVIPFIELYPDVNLNMVYSSGKNIIHKIIECRKEHDDTIKLIEYMMNKGVKTNFSGRLNLTYKIIQCMTYVEYNNIKLVNDGYKNIIKKIGLDNIDWTLPIVIKQKNYMISEILDELLGVWY